LSLPASSFGLAGNCGAFFISLLVPAGGLRHIAEKFFGSFLLDLREYSRGNGL